MKHYTGECLCGACRYVISTKKPAAMFMCHCSRCRKEIGSAFGATVFFDEANLSSKRGKQQQRFRIARYKKKTHILHHVWKPTSEAGGGKAVVLPAGTLDDDAFLEPTAHIFCTSRASWEDKLIHLQRFDELPE